MYVRIGFCAGMACVVPIWCAVRFAKGSFMRTYALMAWKW